MAYERIGEKHSEQMMNGQRSVYVAAEAHAVRVTVRRDGLTRSAEVEILGPDTDGWASVVLEAVRLDGSAESGRVGAVLTFPSGERVTIGAPTEAMRASALCVDPAASARWWQTVGAWGATFGDGYKRIDAYQVLQVEGDRGAWVRSMAGALDLAPAGWLDGMTPIAPPPPFVGADALRAELGANKGETLIDAARRNARHLMSIVSERDEATAQLRRIGYAIDAEPGADLVAEAIRLRDNYRVALKNGKAAYAALVKAESDCEAEAARHAATSANLRAALGAMEAERDSLRDALASLESTFRHWADAERNGAWEAFKDPCLKDKEIRLRVGADAWTKAADEVARVRKESP